MIAIVAISPDFVKMPTRLLTQSCAAGGLTGRNNIIYKDFKKELSSYKPRLGLKEMQLEPDEHQVLAWFNAKLSSVGSIDPSDSYFQVVKTPQIWKKRKAEVRRFVPGHTCFKSMKQVPILTKEFMTKITYEEREKVFREVTGSEIYLATAQTTASGGEAEPEEEEDVDDGEPEVAIISPSSKVVFFGWSCTPRHAVLGGWGNRPKADLDTRGTSRKSERLQICFVPFWSVGFALRLPS